MAAFTINSKLHGTQTFETNGHYVRLNLRQICEGGKTTGATLVASRENLESVARKWWSAKLRNDRNEGNFSF